MSSLDELLKKLHWRAAVKKFDSLRKISTEDFRKIEESLILTPSSYGLQPWKIVVVEDIAIREKLRAASWNQSQVTDSSHYVVFLAKKTLTIQDIDCFVDRIVEVRKSPREKLNHYRQVMIADLVEGARAREIFEWATRQAYIALGQLMMFAAAAEIDTCPMEGLDPVRYDEILGLQKGDYRTVVACALGYRHADDAYCKLDKVRKKSKDLLTHL